MDAFILTMNKKAEEIGLSETVFYNPTGLDIDANLSGAYGTTRDIALLLEHIMNEKPLLLAATQAVTSTNNSENHYVHTATNTNEYVQSLPGLLASKTGFTDLAGGNLAIIFDSGIGTPIIIVVFGSSQEGRFRDVEELVWASLDSVSIP